MKPQSGARALVRGFSLVELLVVLAVIAILAALTAAAIQGTLGGVDLKGGSNMVSSELDLARQTASTRNVAVEVRLYQDSGQAKDGNGNYPYRILAVVISAASSGATSDEFIGQPLSFQGDVIIDSSTNYSSLLNTALLPATPPPSVIEATSAPFLVEGKNYVRFIFLPNGSLNLSQTDGSGNSIAWTLTLVNRHGKAATVASAPAANYVTFLFDVPTGRVRTYQP